MSVDIYMAPTPAAQPRNWQRVWHRYDCESEGERNKV